MPSINFYPRGFSSSQRDGKVDVSYNRVDGDPIVSRVFVRYMDNISERSWTDKSDLFKSAYQLIGPNLAEWLAIQLQNEYLDDNAVRYLNDSLLFLQTGRRSIDNLTWFSVLSNNPNQGRPEHRKVTIEVKSLKSIYELEAQWLQLWLSWPNGLTDFTGFMYLVFGEIDPKTAFKLSAANFVQSPKNFKPQLAMQLMSQ